jgi:hypothetical protein
MKMLPISGTSIAARTLPTFTWNADLIAFDGPLLSLFRSEHGTDALFSWLDCDKRRNRWAIIDVSRDTLRAYLNRDRSLLDVFQASTSVVVFEQVSARKSNIKKTVWTKLPQSYLPTIDSFLTPDIATPDAVRLASELPIAYSIKLDGELYLEDLAGIPKLYQQLYSFHYGLEHLDRAAVRAAVVSLFGKWKSGLSAVNLFTGLRNVTPSIHRPRLKTLQYNSPGQIKMELLPKMAEQIRLAANRIDTEQSYGKAEELYKDIYKYFKENGISGFEDERGSKEANLTPQQNRELRQYVNSYLQLLNWHNYQAQLAELEVGPLSQLRALLAYHRRLRRLLGYVQNGLIELT